MNQAPEPLTIAVNGWFMGQLGSGSGQYLLGLLRNLPAVAGGHELWLVTAAGASGATPAGWRSLALKTPFDGRSDNLSKLWFEQISFPAACRRLRADAGLTPYWGAPWWQPCPMAVTVHDLIPLLLPLYRGGPWQRAYTALVSHTARRAQAALTDSQASARDLVGHLRAQPQRVHPIHLAVDPHYRRVTDPAALRAAVERYGLPDEPFLLYLGGFDARKGVSRLLQAYARLSAQHPQGTPQLVIAGRAPSIDSAFAPDPRRLVRELGLQQRVRLVGWVDETDKPALYSLALAALFVSEYEGFGLPVLEAQACGCPVITSAA